jgi:hypothetical protein
MTAAWGKSSLGRMRCGRRALDEATDGNPRRGSTKFAGRRVRRFLTPYFLDFESFNVGNWWIWALVSGSWMCPYCTPVALLTYYSVRRVG